MFHYLARLLKTKSSSKKKNVYGSPQRIVGGSVKRVDGRDAAKIAAHEIVTKYSETFESLSKK